jgi:hypothetical protein
VHFPLENALKGWMASTLSLHGPPRLTAYFFFSGSIPFRENHPTYRRIIPDLFEEMAFGKTNKSRENMEALSQMRRKSIFPVTFSFSR